MPIISQGIQVPSGLLDGQVAQAAQITPLYNALNAFNIPDSIGVFQQAYVDNNKYSINTGSSQDWFFTVPKEKAIIGMFTWKATGTSPTFVFRVNQTAVTAALVLATAGAGFGVFFIGGHDTTDAPRAFRFLGWDNASRETGHNADLSNVDTTSFGITLGAAGTACDFKYVKIWREG